MSLRRATAPGPCYDDPVPKIESVRPGEAFASSLGEHPLAELLMGILRGNLSGLLQLELEPGVPNHLSFRDGVPVAVQLPSLGVSLAAVLAGRGELAPDAAARVASRAAAEGSSESRVIELERVVAAGALREGVRARARLELERLFEVGDHPFVFTEGAPVPPGADLAVLQPLPIIYAGLARGGLAGPVARFAARWGQHRFRLAETYPRGVDPFEWGPDIDAIVGQLEEVEPLAALEAAGLERTTALVVLATLHTADMLELHDPAQRRDVDLGPPDEPATDLRYAPDQVRAAMAMRLDPWAGATYFEVLRLTPQATSADVERAYQALVRRLDARADDVGLRGLQAMLDDAARTLRDPVLGAAYRAALADVGPRAEGTRRRLEAEPKTVRAIEALVSGRAGEAAYWIDWALTREPQRVELHLYRELLMLFGAPPAQRREIAEVIAPSVRLLAAKLEPFERAWGAVACVDAARGDVDSAERRLGVLGPLGAAWRPAVLRLASGAEAR
jgi:hypothetical protein